MSHPPCLQRVWVSQSLITVPFFHDTRKPLPHWRLGNQNWSPGFWLPFRGCLFLVCTSVYLEGATGKGGWALAESLSLGSLIYLGPQLTGQVWAAFLDRGEYSPNSRWKRPPLWVSCPRFFSPSWCGLQYESTAEVQALYPEPEPLPRAWHPGFRLCGPPFPSPSYPRPSWTDSFSWCCSDSLNTPPVSQPLIYA